MNALAYLKQRQVNKLRRKAQESTEITKEAILASCIENEGYETPELNDKLFLHFHWFTKINNLDDYSNITTLWLSSNAIKVIENISHLKNLKCLFLDQNAIEKISGLEELTNLVTLDLSSNFIKNIEGISKLSNLETLNIAKNQIDTIGGIESLLECQSINTLDIANNKLDDPNFLIIFKQMPNLAHIKMSGNPIVRRTKNYRKQLIHDIEKLSYLDDRPVFEEERLFTEAFFEGGIEKEKQAREIYQQNKAKERENDLEKFLQWQEVFILNEK